MNRPLHTVRRARWGAAAVALLAALTVTAPGAAMAAETARAEGDGELGIQSIDHWFGVRNLTSYPMTALGVQEVFSGTPPRFGDDLPANPGEVFDPGTEDFFKMTFWLWYNNGAYLNYQIGDIGAVAMKLTLDPWIGTPTWQCFAISGPLTCDVSGGSAYIFSDTPTERVIEASNQREQSDALARLCDIQSSHISCSFEPKGEIRRATRGPHPIAGDVENFNCKSQTLSRYTFTWGLEQGFSTSVGGSFSAGGTFMKVIEVSVSVNFQETWSWTKVTQESHAADIAPGYWTWVEQHPIWRSLTGDVTAVIGKDTVIVRDVTIDAPGGIHDGRGAVGSLERIMTPADRVEFCHESPEVAQRRYDLVLAASPDGAPAEAPGAGDPIEEASVAESPAFSDPDEIAEFEAAFEAAG